MPKYDVSGVSLTMIGRNRMLFGRDFHMMDLTYVYQRYFIEMRRGLVAQGIY